MAAISGTAGSVLYMTGGTAVIGNISEWSLSLSQAPVETTAFGDGDAAYVPSIRNNTGSFSGNHDDDDAQQDSLRTAQLASNAIALRLHLDAGDYYAVGTAYITGMDVGVSQAGKAEVSYDFQVSGPVTYTSA